MSLTAAQVQFAAEFVTLVVAASALALILLRPPVRRAALAAAGSAGARPAALAARPAALAARLLAGASLALVAAAAFAHGALLVTGYHLRWVGVGRLVGAAALLATLPSWWGRRLAARRLGAGLLPVGFLAWAAAGVIEIAGAGSGEYAVDACLVAGSLATAAALATLVQQSIAVRVAAGGAAALLLVVLVLALAQSTVISSSVQRQELSRLATRLSIEKAALSETGPVADAARSLGTDLQVYNLTVDNPLTNFAFGTPAQASAAATLISSRLDQLASLDPTLDLAYAAPSGQPVLVAGSAPPGVGQALGTDPALLLPSCTKGEQGLLLGSERVWLAASYPECTANGLRLGTALSSQPVDDAYLATRRAIDPTVALALVEGGSVVASSGPPPPAGALGSAAHSEPGRLVTEAVGDRYVSLATLAAAGSDRSVAMVLSSPATSVLSTRNQLFRTLFLIAFGGTVLALGLAIFTADRITAGVRRLTLAAAGIQSGDHTVRAGVSGEDEVAALGSAFDSMIDSVSAQSSALRAAAEAEARLRNRLEAVVGGMTDALVATDPAGVITDFNAAAARLTGTDATRAIGRPVESVVRLRDDTGAGAPPRIYRPGRRPESMTGTLERAEGPPVAVAASSGALAGPGGDRAGSVLVVRDMRHDVEVEQMKTEFLSRVGHELRTPLTGIMGYADILQRRDVPPDRARQWHEEILLSARRLLRIVEMLEFFASEGAGRMTLRPEPVDVRALVNGIASSWAGRLPDNLSLGRRVGLRIPPVLADRRWLTLAVDELIDNAVKFSPEGGRILVTVKTVDGDDGERVEITVRDRGMGMTAEQYAVVFSDFVQADSSDTRRFGGLGLGLAVVRRVVEGHSGSIRCRSAPGRGTTFVISLPVDPSTAAEVAPRRPARGKSRASAASRPS